MKILETVSQLKAELEAHKSAIIGFVPTMGALHAGHLSLVDRARKECDIVVASVFVNPTQFNDKGDLATYPRTPEADGALLEKGGVDYILMPSVEEIYPTADTRIFDFGAKDKVMEGASRPGHFNGVAQVVSRLFEIVEPTKAYFGEKDFQQIAIIRAMVEMLSINVEIVDCPIVRDADGLALSSRNMLLTPEHRAAAPQIYKALCGGVELSKSASPEEVAQSVESAINSNKLLKVVYFKIVDSLTLQEVKEWSDSEAIQGCITVQAGAVRLIDNIKFR
ncbi:MAG: pantoate--beta-alanine ligase [Rikenellaceae bacterium]